MYMPIIIHIIIFAVLEYAIRYLSLNLIYYCPTKHQPTISIIIVKVYLVNIFLLFYVFLVKIFKFSYIIPLLLGQIS